MDAYGGETQRKIPLEENVAVLILLSCRHKASASLPLRAIGETPPPFGNGYVLDTSMAMLVMVAYGTKKRLGFEWVLSFHPWLTDGKLFFLCFFMF